MSSGKPDQQDVNVEDMMTMETIMCSLCSNKDVSPRMGFHPYDTSPLDWTLRLKS
jgi:hypothetical protein